MVETEASAATALYSKYPLTKATANAELEGEVSSKNLSYLQEYQMNSLFIPFDCISIIAMNIKWTPNNWTLKNKVLPPLNESWHFKDTVWLSSFPFFKKRKKRWTR